MTNDDIIRMAREVGIDAERDTICSYEGLIEPLERFAALVVAHEREECAKVCEDKWATLDEADIFAAFIRARGEK